MKIKFFYCLFIVLFGILGLAESSLAANYPLEIINIKPAGTGSPAIPSTNRIFRAYPGIEYNIRAAVIGGLYPFTYSLSNAPSGMTINSKTGEISWPNPQANSGIITLSVTDAENTTVTTTWAITVSTSGFYFVDGSYGGTETGSITQPFSSLSNMFAGTSSDEDIIYFRAGTYPVYQYNQYQPSDGASMRLAGKSHTWLAYQSETVIFTGPDNAYIRGWGHPVYFDGLTFMNFTNRAMMIWGGENYQTIRRSVFDNVTANSAINNNYGFIYTTSAGNLTYGYYFVIQDNDFSHWTGASGIGSIYSIGKALIENNYFHDTNGGGLSGINNAMGLKANIYNLFVRGNKVIVDSGYVFGTNMNSQFANSDNVDVSFNYFKSSVNNRTNGMVHSLNGFGGAVGMPLNNFYYYRNTVEGDISIARMNGATCAYSDGGPFIFNNNVIINPNTDVSGYRRALNYFYYGWDDSSTILNCLTDSNNLKGVSATGIIDSNGLLTAGYSSSLGTRGWQLADGSTPMGAGSDTTPPASPTGLSVV